MNLKQIRRGLSLGPRYKIQVPKFQFEEAEREEKQVENILEAQLQVQQMEGSDGGHQYKQNNRQIYRADHDMNSGNNNNKFNNDNNHLPEIQQREDHTNHVRNVSGNYRVANKVKEGSSSIKGRSSSYISPANQQLNQSELNKGNLDMSFNQQGGAMLPSSNLQQQRPAYSLNTSLRRESGSNNKSKDQSHNASFLTGGTGTIMISQPQQQQHQSGQMANDLEWLQKLENKNLAKSIKKPARNIQKIENNLSLIGASSKVTKSPVKAVQTMHQQKKQLQQMATTTQQFQMEARASDGLREGQEFRDLKTSEDHQRSQSRNIALLVHKNLKNFDCYDEEITPQQWVEHYKGVKSFHAICPIYVNKQYMWTQVQVEDYDVEAEKFLVRIMQTGQLKYVSRLSLRFKDEDPAKFKERVENAKQLMLNADDELRFIKFVDNQASEQFMPLSSEWRKDILAFCMRQKKLGKGSSGELTGTLGTPGSPVMNKQTERRVSELMTQVQAEYMRFQKKSFILLQMADPSNAKLWQVQRVYNRFVAPEYPLFGQVCQFDLAFQEVAQQLVKAHLYSKPPVVRALNMVTQRSQELQNIFLFQVNLGKEHLPMNLQEFEKLQNQFHEKQRISVSLQWREYVITQIQDMLRDVYRFYQTDPVAYLSSELRRLLKSIDCIFNTFLRKTVVQKSINDYCSFLQRFNVPKSIKDQIPQQEDGEPKSQGLIQGSAQEQSSSQLEKTFSSYSKLTLWLINPYPLIVLNLLVNVNFRNSKRKDTKRLSKKGDEQLLLQKNISITSGGAPTLNNLPSTVNEQLETSEELPIYFEPSLQAVQETLLKPMEWLVQTTLSYRMLEKDLVPLVEMKERASFAEIKDSEHSLIEEGIQRCMQCIQEGFREPIAMLEVYKQFNFLIEKSVGHVVRTLFGDSKEKPFILNIDRSTVIQKIEHYLNARKQIERCSLDDQNGRFFQIRTKQAKEVLSAKATEVVQAILQRLNDICTDNIERIGKTYAEISEKVLRHPSNERELVDLKLTIAENEVQLAKLNTEVNAVQQCFSNILEPNCFEVIEAVMSKFWDLKTRPQEIRLNVGEGQRTAQLQEEKLTSQLELEKDKFLKELKELQGEFAFIRLFKEYSKDKVKDNASVAMSLMDRIYKSLEKVKSFNEREALFRIALSEYQDLDKLLQDFTPYHKMWEIAMEVDMDFEQWTTGPLLKIQYSIVEKKVNQQFYKETIKLQKVFGDLEDEAASSVIGGLRKHIEHFRETMWMIELLTTDAMNNAKRSLPHWQDIFRECGVQDIPLNEELSLVRLMQEKLQEHREIIEEVSRKAEKQWAIEKKLKEMEDKVKELQVVLMSFKNTGTSVLKSVDEIQQTLDDQLNVLIMMKASPYMKPVIRVALALEVKIVLIQDTLEQCLKCQRAWMYLEPIFASEDIKKKMEMEQKKFQRVDEYWRDAMEHFTKETHLWDAIDTEKMKTEFLQHNRTLDQIQKSLTEYLETKRKFFPRFFFLSDEELLEILADTKDPLKVQKHINKCFEAINQLEFSSEQCVLSMASMEKEKVAFVRSIDVNEGDRKGNVERWLLEIEKVMIETLIKVAKDTMGDIHTARPQWVQKWPGQIVLCVNMMRWTAGAEAAIHNSKITGDEATEGVEDQLGNYFKNLADYSSFLDKQLLNIVELVRQELPELTRLTLGALVVLDVHARDVVSELARRGCQSVQEFMWISQLRYYWVEQRKEQIMWVKMINAQLKYGFEYLGNSPRLVITPLTDRCYRTLMGAFHLQYGGAPEGPAGTGKTETVKDLAKACAMMCVVFNCSDGLNFLAMRKFFKGLASSGGWCCFDEFNRIDLEVLSVIAQQVLTIQTAIKERRKVFTFDDDEIALVLSCCINITMNPGYAGRSELPDNLKALFRPCAMMVPDYALIAEIYLYSVGFQDARNLARKVVASLRLSSEQLSSQDHYDFGMRALKAILTAAGNLKRVMVKDVEDIIVLRALNDVNLPKFTFNDVPLFLSITSDLFPGVNLPNIDYGRLEDALKMTCYQNNLQAEKNFLMKCIQLYDTINVRHGLMLVGAAFAGKSSVLECLQKGMTSLKGVQSFVSVAVYKLNPKAITGDQLYGRLDADTKQWSDGVIALIMRACAQDVDLPERKWVVFDGPVDAVWIENMNTVLDDNKKLCLTSGEIIKLTNWMTMMFEVEDLAQASPATVSRCGMVFMETQQLGWDPLVRSFAGALPHPLLDKYRAQVQARLLWLLDHALAWSFRHGRFPVHRSEMNIVCTCLRLVRAQLSDFFQTEGGATATTTTTAPATTQMKDAEDMLDQVILFAVVWSVGAALEESVRKGFHEFLLKLITGVVNSNYSSPEFASLDLRFPNPATTILKEAELTATLPGTKLPERMSFFDLCFERGKNIWINWAQTVEKMHALPKGVEYNQLFVPTVDSIRNNYFLHKSVQNRIHMLLVGPTGTGKTVNVINQLQKFYFNAEYTNLCTAFSGQTQANQVQRLIESKVCTRRRKGYFGPEEGKKHIVIFIDDLNMPAKERYGAQPPIELLRQWMDTGGWFDLDTKEQKYLQDIVFIAAMLPPTGGRNAVTMRYLRHFCLLYAPPFEAESLMKIFTAIVEWIFASANTPQLSVPTSIVKMGETIVDTTITLYNRIQTSKELLPTPAKSHYIYNLRDISKVFQGIAKATVRSYHDENDFIKLWAHECMRVFQDRLVSLEDQAFFDTILKELVQTKFHRTWDELVTVQPLLWAAFVPTLYPDGDTSKRPLSDVYCELTNREALRKKCQEQLEEYNNFYSANRMNLVLFSTAVQHVIKIVRVLTTALGHALLVGVGGSGRKSLATLSAFIAFQTEPFTVDPKNWTEEMQKLMKTSGLEGKETILLFSDSQISKESMVEDISNILNNGEVPNLFPAEEKAKILEEVELPGGGTPNEKYAHFVARCRQMLHLVLAFSPVGEAFRRRLRTFPSLVNCTTIDWFLPWPEEALRNTAANLFTECLQTRKISRTRFQSRARPQDSQEQQKQQEQQKPQLQQQQDDPQQQQQPQPQPQQEEATTPLDALVEVAVDMQTRVTQLSKRYLEELRRYYYVTPTSYLELLATFKRLLQERTLMIEAQIQRYDNGSQKIFDTEKVVDRMERELKDLQPLLIKKTEENQNMLVNLTKKQREADAKREICAAEEQECNVQREEANVLRTDCQGELDKVLPLLESAAQALENIKKDDLNTLKSFTKPPDSAAIVMEGICYAFDEDQNVKFVPVAPGSMEKKQDFWEYAKKKLLNDKLLARVKNFKEDQIKSIPGKKVDKLKLFVQNPLFEKEKVFNASKAAGNLALWIRAVVDTYDALLVVEPKRQQLAGAEAKLKQAEATLNEKKAALKQVIDLLDSLQRDYERAKAEKEELENKVNKCKVQLERAGKLISGLGGEKKSWQDKSLSFRAQVLTTIGDCLLCAGIIAYLGAFPPTYRDETIAQWRAVFKRPAVLRVAPLSENFSLQQILCDPITQSQWTNTYKLPNDAFSIDNAIILKNSHTRWPLLIDPQTQANTWVKKMEAANNMRILRPTQSQNDLLLQVQNAITLGIPVLLENITEVIDQLFEPVLQKKLIKSGSSCKLKFGDKIIDYNSDFRFYMTTKLARPHYPPEVCVKVTMLNFTVTAEGLEDQMLNIVVQIEEPIKDQQRQKNIIEYSENLKIQRRTEDKILRLLQEAQGDLLDDEVLIDTLQNSQAESLDIQEKLRKQEHDKEIFNNTRNFYREVALRVAHLYFVILDLALIEPTYQWSLDFYINLFVRAIDKASQQQQQQATGSGGPQPPPSKDPQRCKNIIQKFQLLLYESICRSLLEKDKLIYSLLLCIKVLEVEKKILPIQVRFLMVGGTWTEPSRPPPVAAANWLSNKMWCTLLEMATSTLPQVFEDFDKDFEKDLEAWRVLCCDAAEPQDMPLPGRWEQLASAFQRLILARVCFPHKFARAVIRLVTTQLGEAFVQPPPFNLELTYADSNPLTPLIFILSPGADPRLEITTLADKFGCRASLQQISLGQGQGEMAEKAIKEAFTEGQWVLLQNCHLAPSFMPELDRILENTPPNVHANFRIWLTSMPSDVFPTTILMKGIKMTFEPPRGLKNNLLRIFNNQQQQDAKKFEECLKPYEWKKLFFGLAFFHALILERRKFGPLGWNIPYEFTTADFTISSSQLRMFLDEYDQIPWEALNYMVAEANYGGRVTDPKDRRLITILLQDFYTPEILRFDYKFGDQGDQRCAAYFAPPESSLNSYREFINALPRVEPSEIFGLHPNAEISSALIETSSICETVLSLLPREQSAGGKSTEQLIKEKIQAILDKLPKPFNLEESSKRHPLNYNESMNTVLQQELIRFNKLLSAVTSSLINLSKAIDGLLVMSQDLETLFYRIQDNRVSEFWHKVSYPSLKPLGSWINDLVERLNFMQNWVNTQAPPSFWISGFFFTQSFLTGTLQNYARKYKIPIDTLQFDFYVITPGSKEYDVSVSPPDGCYIFGLYFDGARWDDIGQSISESEPKVLYSKVPYIWLLPTDEKRDYDKNRQVYECPVYKTSRRAGTLSTTGHSTNYVLSIYLPISKKHQPEHWVKRGLAALTQLDD